MDDVLVHWARTVGKLHNFFDVINSLSENIVFTNELSRRIDINFLHLHLEIVNNKIEFDIHHKTTQTGQF